MGDLKGSSPWACYCNKVSRERVVAAILEEGASNLSDIYDKTTAGAGPCGGSCRRTLLELLSLHCQKKESSQVSPNEEPVAALVEAVSLFNRRYYWEAHEVLERAWLEEQGPRKLFYQGLIQAAASYYHVLNANPRGVLKLAEEAFRKLDAYRPQYDDVWIEGLLLALKEIIVEAKEILGSTRSGFDYDKLPKLELR